ncbi:MAG: GerW family sporulation protein [Oscillospiraceae bacterium]|nr:GerW family sporulation protein [Oscillospiraceae bacterium]
MADHPISGMMDTTLQKIREMVDASTVIGDPISAGDTTVIPVSKISYGFASGGSDLPVKLQKDFFGGAGGAGVTVLPVAFLVITPTEVKLLQVDEQHDSIDKAIDAIPGIIDKIKAAFSGGKKSKKDHDEEL